ncbi:hypothetical protein [Listeria cornellensis]|uniref:hypothetical protein n=1 Tax=Listeria cornellensis TaxID=1494961 RepID=UPI0004BA65E2|nr:hypothetical protein [Listeria cornellensis]
MILNDVYSYETIEREFNTKQLFALLSDKSFLEVSSQKIYIKKGERIELGKDKLDYVYYISQGVAAASIRDQIIDFRGATDFFWSSG